MNKLYFISSVVLLSFLALLFSGCTPLRPTTDPEKDKVAKQLSYRAKSFNQLITTSKGTGWARLETEDGVAEYKIAWAIVSPYKIRLTFLMAGHPVETIIATGQKITFFSHTGQHAKRSFKAQDPDMEDYIQVPVKLSEIISILLGRMPIKPYDDAYFPPFESSSTTVILHKKFIGQGQRLHFDNEQNITRISSTDVYGKMLYDINFLTYKAYDFGLIPTKIEVIDKKNQKLTLTITKFIANPEVKDSVFVLTEPG